MKIIAQTNKEWLCIECESFLYVILRIGNELNLVCRNKDCVNSNIVVEIKLQREYIDAKVIK